MNDSREKYPRGKRLPAEGSFFSTDGQLAYRYEGGLVFRIVADRTFSTVGGYHPPQPMSELGEWESLDFSDTGRDQQIVDLEAKLEEVYSAYLEDTPLTSPEDMQRVRFNRRAFIEGRAGIRMKNIQDGATAERLA